MNKLYSIQYTGMEAMGHDTWCSMLHVLDVCNIMFQCHMNSMVKKVFLFQPKQLWYNKRQSVNV